MNIRSRTLLLALAVGSALSASPTIAAPPVSQIREISGLKMESDVIDAPRGRKTPRAIRSSKPKEIVVVGSKPAQTRDMQLVAWHETVLMGDM
jgi:hypothetical protein